MVCCKVHASHCSAPVHFSTCFLVGVRPRCLGGLFTRGRLAVWGPANAVDPADLMQVRLHAEQQAHPIHAAVGDIPGDKKGMMNAGGFG